ncbi:MAG: hypothetical protein EVA70_08580 [Parvularculaceae bacterium]|nr:MAG: hypothetical protein EVA70_08580 [Parvularculaceae bacterium]
MTLKSLLFIAAFTLSCSVANAQENLESEEESPHHVSVVLGGTHVASEDLTAFTVGIDYEYRVNRLLGLGFVVERAFGEIDATTVLAVADIHIWRGLAVQAGPGIEFVGNEEVAVGRIGTLYEVTLDSGYTISPQLHYDISAEEDSLVFGIAIGRVF